MIPAPVLSAVHLEVGVDAGRLHVVADRVAGSVFEPEPESPGVIAPKNMKWSGRHVIAVPERGVPPAPTPVPWP